MLLIIWLSLSSFMPILGQLSSKLESTGSQIRCLENERQALVKFKQEIIDEYGRLSSWGVGENEMNCCKWRGVYCHNRTSHVTRLDLRAPFVSNRYESTAPLQGKSISPSLLELQHLEYLDLSLNHFDGAPIPEFIGSLKNLRYLNLSNAYFYGSIPHHIGNLSELLYLDLGNTQLHSENLEWLSHLRPLKYLNLKNVNLSMATNWLEATSKLDFVEELHLAGSNPPEILSSSLLPFINTSTSTLVVLDLSNNQYISPLTLRWLLNFSSSLKFIDVSFNNINGTIPDAFDNMMSLTHIDLSGNSLEGGIPKSFGNMSSLIHLDLMGNSLTGPLFEVMMNLSGPVERKLQYLNLGWNMISGSFPDVRRFSSLKELRLRGYLLKGSIPDPFVQLPKLLVLDLSYNNLTGSVPDLSFCSSLKELNLDKNKFSGISVKSIRGLSQLVILSLNLNQLEGIITEAHLFNLSQLQKLDLSSNPLLNIKFSHQWVPPFQLKYTNLANCKLGPPFPKWLRNQKRLFYLDIANTTISDFIPSWFTDLASQLVYFNASNNQMFGSFPNVRHSTFNLTYGRASFTLPLPYRNYPAMDLSRNNISGSVIFLCHTPYWSLLDLSTNQLSEQLPDCFANFTSMKYLNLADNNFSGKIPDSFGSLLDLSWLHLRNNSFAGGIPASMMNCKNLQMIDLGENRLTGKIPAWIGDGFSKLAFLRLSSNELFGSIPSSVCSLQTLQILDLSSNNISGPIPKCLSNLTAMTSKKVSMDRSFSEYYARWDIGLLGTDTSIIMYSSLDSAYLMWKGTKVKYTNNLKLVKLIDLSNNNLTGEIPTEITKLDDLIGLNLSRNNLTGSIPRNIGELKSLNFLDLSRNHLSGRIPTGLSELSHLGILNLSSNNLSGRIPQNSHMLTLDESAYAGNPELCGRPLNKFCPALFILVNNSVKSAL